jgi:hypothetical protein
VVLTVDSGAPPVGGNTGHTTKEAKKNDGNLKNGKSGRADGREFAHLAPQARPGHAAGNAAVGPYRLEGNLERSYRLPTLATWKSNTLARTVGFSKDPGFGFDGSMLRAGNNWTANPNHLASPRLPVVAGWQQNNAHGTAMKRLLPSLRQR